MAAGLPVVEIHRENTIYDFPDEAMLLCEQTPEAIATGLIEILSSQEQGDRMSKAGMDFMPYAPIKVGLNQFSNVVTDLLKGKTATPALPEQRYHLHALTSKIRKQPSRSEYRPDITGQGRLAFLPTPFRKVLRFFYHRLRRILP